MCKIPLREANWTISMLKELGLLIGQNNVEGMKDFLSKVPTYAKNINIALMLSALYGQFKMVKVCVDDGANLEAQWINDDTPLILASKNGTEGTTENNARGWSTYV